MDPNRTQALSADPNRTQLGVAPTLDPNRTVMGTAPSLNATVTIKPVQCPVCKAFNPAGMMFCNDCGLIFDRALPDDAFGAPAIQLPQLVGSGGKELVIRPGSNFIGREGTDMSLGDGRVSRRHAELISDGGTFRIQDLGSTNGTTVNGNALVANQPMTVQPGDKIAFGGMEFQIQLPGGPSGNATQTFASNKTAAMAVAPKVSSAAAFLEGNGERYPLKAGINSFGRKPENDVQISDPYVSGKHGLIEVAEDGHFVTDTGSTNGTKLGDATLVPNMRTRMQPDDMIRLGSLEFRIVSA
jgi:pSer/pThr/pTyr-binding forkhead associated (FHA) protein